MKLLLNHTIILLLNHFAPKLAHIYNGRIKAKFKEIEIKYEIKWNKISFNHRNVVGDFIVYELHMWSYNQGADFTLRDCLFGTVKLTKTVDPDKRYYYRYGIKFDTHATFSFPNGEFRKNVVIFGVENFPLVRIDNRKKIY